MNNQITNYLFKGKTWYDVSVRVEHDSGQGGVLADPGHHQHRFVINTFCHLFQLLGISSHKLFSLNKYCIYQMWRVFFAQIIVYHYLYSTLKAHSVCNSSEKLDACRIVRVGLHCVDPDVIPEQAGRGVLFSRCHCRDLKLETSITVTEW